MGSPELSLTEDGVFVLAKEETTHFEFLDPHDDLVGHLAQPRINSILEAAAEYSGCTVEELREKLENGETIQVPTDPKALQSLP